MRTSTWFLIIAVVALGWVFLRGGEQRFATAERRQPLDYDTVAVSDGMTAEARALDLEDDLDVSLLPAIGKQVIREAAQQGLKEQAFLEYVLREVSNRVREISTIDLNADGTTDPVLVRPEPGGAEQYVLLAVQVPAPDAYPLPAAGDAAAWKALQTVEVATMTVSLNEQQLAVEASGNKHVYPNAQGQHYSAYDRSSSFLQTYFAIRMLDWMFFPSYWGFWGPGWGYGFYQPTPVPAVRNQRADTVRSRGYARGTARGTPSVRGRSGAVPRSRYQRAYSANPPRSLSRLQASRGFSRGSGGAVRSGGFGRGRSSSAVGRGATSRRTVQRGTVQRGGARRYSNMRGYSRGFGGFGRGRSRGFFGGGGMRFGK